MDLHEVLHRDDVPADVKDAVRRAIAAGPTGDAAPLAAAAYAAALASAPVGVALLSPDGRFLEVNEHACRITGRSVEQLLSMSIADLKPPDDLPAHKARHDALVTGEATSVVGVFPCVRADGTRLWLNAAVSRVNDEAGSLQALLCILVDVTETKLAQPALETSEERYRDLLSHGDDWVWRMNTQGVFTYSSPVCARLTGYEPSELVGGPGSRVLTPEAAAEVEGTWQERLSGEPDFSPATVQAWHRRKDGSEFLAEVRAVPIVDPDGVVREIQGITRDISEHAAMEAALRASEERYRLMFEKSPVSLWVEDFSAAKQQLDLLREQGVTDVRDYLTARPDEVSRLASLVCVVDVNETTLSVYRASSREELMASLQTVLADVPGAALIEELAAIADSRLDLEIETSNRRLDGESMEVVLKWSVAPGAEDTYERVLLAVSDVTEQRRAARALAESERRYRALVDNLTDLVVETDVDGRLLFVSPSYCQTFGMTQEELLGTCFMPLVHPDDQPAVAVSLQRALRPPYQSHHEERALTKDGWRWFEWRTGAVTTAGGQVDRITAVGRDITEAKQGELALAESEERFRSLFENAPVGIFHVGADMKLIRANEALARMFRYQSPDEMVQAVNDSDIRQALYWDPLTPPVAVDAPGTAEGWERREGQYRRRDGDAFTGQLIFRVVHGPDGAPSHYEGFIEDVTERREAERRMTTLLDYLPGIAFLKDTQSVYLACNQALCDALGLPKDEIVGRTDYDLYPHELADLYRHDDATVLRTGRRLSDIEEEGVFGGRSTHFTTTKVPVIGAAGQPVGLIGLSVDLSQRRRAEEAQRLATVGQLAAGVAHEFNNIMASMMLRAQFARRRGLLADYEKLADLVVHGATRGKEICRGLTSFAESHEVQPHSAHVHQAIETALSLAAGELAAAGVQVVRAFTEADACVRGDSGQLSQVFLSMVINACQAMPDGGTLTVSTRQICTEDGCSRLLVSLQDTGTGIAPEHLPRIFDPFFTTKGVMGSNEGVNGTGLGLSVAHGILRRHGATVDVRSRVGEGTTFALSFPTFAGEAAATSPACVPQPAPTGTRILVAEDDEDVRAIVTEALGSSGYQVVQTPAATDVETLLGQGGFSLVIADLMMPGGGAREVLRAAAAVRPSVPVVILTGRIEAHLVHELTALGAAEVLRKPIAIDDLCSAAARVITASPSASP